MSLSIIILAAGKGTRMNSARPKVVHPLAGKPMLQRVVDTSRLLNPQQIIVVIGHGSEQVTGAVTDPDLLWVEQTEQLGTGHAVMQCNDLVTPGNDILVLYGDVPLISASTLQQLIAESEGTAVVCLLSFMAANPQGYGRIVRDATHHVQAIVEEKDASDEIRAIHESNSGILLVSGNEYRTLLSELDNNNVQQEYYLTDVVKHAVARGHEVTAVICDDEREVLGVNNQVQLAQLEAVYREHQATQLMNLGVKLADPKRIDVRGSLETGRDVSIDINCIFEGEVVLGDGVRVGANCVIRDSHIGEGSEILPMTMIDDSSIGANNSIGPFARIRPATVTDEQAKIGNFVEIKKSAIGKGSKVSHLSYIGDTEMGSQVNIGAGTITCNYDGANKHQTVIEDGVFVGSDTQLVAPVKVAKDSTIGAGSTITRDTPQGKLSLSRSKQLSIKGWQRPVKNR